MKHKCPNKKCGYEWVARVRKPKQCPYCKRYIPLINFQQSTKKKEEENNGKYSQES